MICLDTNAVIGLLNGRDAALRARFEAQIAMGARMLLPAVALFELRCGQFKSDRRRASQTQLERLLSRGLAIAPFEEADAAHAGDIRAHLEAKGTPIGAYDILIAAQARCRGATLVTANTREFDRVPGLLVVDWAA